MKPKEVKKLKVGNKLTFRGQDDVTWIVKEIDDKFIYLVSHDEDWSWDLFKLPTHPLWKGFTKVE